MERFTENNQNINLNQLSDYEQSMNLKLSRYLRERRENKGFTRSQVANFLETTPEYVEFMERGSLPITAIRFFLLAKVLGFDILSVEAEVLMV